MKEYTLTLEVKIKDWWTDIRDLLMCLVEFEKANNVEIILKDIKEVG